MQSSEDRIGTTMSYKSFKYNLKFVQNINVCFSLLQPCLTKYEPNNPAEPTF